MTVLKGGLGGCHGLISSDSGESDEEEGGGENKEKREHGSIFLQKHGFIFLFESLRDIVFMRVCEPV